MIPDQDKTKEQLIAELAELRLKSNSSESSSSPFESELRKVNRALKLLIAANHSILSSSTGRDLMQAICSKSIEAGGYKMAWVGFAMQDENKTVRPPVAQSGDEDSYLSSIVITWSDTELGQGPAGTAIRTGKLCISRDIATDPCFAPWRAEATKRGYGAVISLPLIAQNFILGALTIYAEEPDSFDEPEVSLLTELAGSLAFGIVSLRTRAARKKTENALQESEKRYRSLVMTASDAIYTINQQGKIISWNKGAETIYGYAAEDIIGQDFLSLIPEQYRAVHGNILQGALSAGVLNNITGPVEGFGRKKDGTQFPLESSLAMFTARDGNFCTVIVRDISKRRQAEEALVESEKQYRDLVESANSVILRFDAQGRITFCNKFTELLFGYSREELIGQSAGNTILPEIDSSGRNLAVLLNDVIANPELYAQNENENICKDGRRLWMSWTNKAIRDEHGNTYEFLSVGNDITAQRQIKIALQESEEKYRTLLNDATDAILLADDTGNILEANKQAEALLGYTARELTGMNFAALHPEHERQTIIDFVSSTLLQQGSWSLHDVHLLRKDGTIFPSDISGRFIEYAGKRVILGIVRDISERKAAAAELDKYRRHLEDLVAARTAELTALNLQLRQEIDERNKIEEALRKSEEQFRTVIETSSDAIVTVDSSGNIVLWNKGAETIYGYTAAEVLHTPFLAMVPEQLRGPQEQNFIELMSAPQAGVINMKSELRGCRKDGSEFPTEGSASLWKTSDGTFITTTVRDITKRKAAEESLVKNTEFYQTILENIVNGVVVTDKDDCLSYFNKGMINIAGVPREQWPSGNILSCFSEDTLRFFVPHYLRARDTVTPVYYDSIPIVTLSGRHTIQSGWMVPLVKDGAFNGMIITVEDRTEQKLTEDALRQKEELFRSVIETASDAIVSADSSGNVILWNKAAEKIFGYSAEEMLNKPFLNIMAEEIRETHWQQFSSFMAQRKPGIVVSHGELRARRKDGIDIPTEGSAAVWKTKDGVFITSIIRDATEKKRAEEALHESEERFRNLAQTAIDAIFLTDENRNIIFWNKAAERVFGYTEEEVLGRISTFVVPEEQREHDEKGYQKLFTTGISPAEGKTFESMGRRKDGTPFPTEVSFSAWRAGVKSFYCVVARDITSRWANESALRESEEKFRTMTEHLTASIFIYQGNNLVYVNPAAEKICGYTCEELLSMNFWDIIHPDFMEQVREWGHRRQAGEELPPRYELKIKTKDGAERWVDYTAAAIYYSGGTAVLGTAIDITERKLVENALRQSEERYRLTAEHVPFHLGASDQSYTFVLWNKYSEKMFGYSPDEVLNKLHPSAVHASPEEALTAAETAMREGIFDAELNLRRRDGSLFPAHLVVVPNKNVSGEVIGLYGLAEDITQRKRAEELIKKVNDCLLSFSADPDKNIQRIIEVAGKMFDGASTSYQKKHGDLLHISTTRNLNEEHLYSPRLKARHFDELFASSVDEPLIMNTGDVLPFLSKNSSMLKMGFESFIAIPIRIDDTIISSLNVAFKEDKSFSPNELNAFSILAKAISIEEERKKVLEDLKQHQLNLKISEKSLKAFSGRILSIREEEKKNISSALHDEIGSMVVAISSGLAIAKEEINENSLEPALKSLKRTEAALKQSVDNLKKIALDLRPPNLDIVGLSNALKSFFLNISQQTKIPIDFSVKMDDKKINDAAAIVLYRTAQEGLNNIVKHAKAKAVSIRLYEEKNSIVFEIADNGRGFDPGSLTASSRAATKIGIQGMRERIAALGGTLEIESAPQKGTTLHITIPKRRGKSHGNKSYPRR